MTEPWEQAKRALRDVQKQIVQLVHPPFTVRYDRVFRSLGAADLHVDVQPFSEDALSLDLFSGGQTSNRFLHYYSQEGARLAFERYGFFDLLRRRGFEPLLVGDGNDPDSHILRIYDQAPEPENLLIELVASLQEEKLPDGTDCRMIFINWLLMQNPHAEFPPDRTPLPDQEHPGLGLFLRFGYLIHLMGRRLECDGLMNHPSYYHNGFLYGKFCHFADPVIEGRYLALRDLLRDVPLAEASHAVLDGMVLDDTGEPFQWQAAPQILPISKAARRWFESPEYRDAVDEARGAAGLTRIV